MYAIVSVEHKKPNGNGWDFFGGKPDIALCHSDGGTKVCIPGGKEEPIAGEDAHCQDTFKCAFKIPGASDEFEIYDVDMSENDIIGEGDCTYGNSCVIGAATVRLVAELPPELKPENKRAVSKVVTPKKPILPADATAFEKAYAKAPVLDTNVISTEGLWSLERAKKVCGADDIRIGVKGKNEFEWRRNEKHRAKEREALKKKVFAIPIYEPIVFPYNFARKQHKISIRAGDTQILGTFTGRARMVNDGGFYDWEVTPLEHTKRPARDAYVVNLPVDETLAEEWANHGSSIDDQLKIKILAKITGVHRVINCKTSCVSFLGARDCGVSNAAPPAMAKLKLIGINIRYQGKLMHEKYTPN